MSSSEPAQPEPVGESAATRPESGRWLGACLIRLFLIPWVLIVLYVLSIGPLFWVWHEAYYMDGNKWIVLFYMPLLLACEIDPVGELVNWYIGLWIV